MYLKVSVPGKFQLKLIPTVQNLLFLQSNDIHYIGGTDVLPAPLEREDENECIMLLGTEDEPGLFGPADQKGTRNLIP